MAQSTILAAGLSIFLGVSILVLLAELYYFHCWRRRVLLANPRVSQEISPVHVVEDAVLSSGQTTSASNELDIIIAGYQEDLELINKKLFPNFPTAAAAAVKVTTDINTRTLKSMSQVSLLSINPDMSQQQLNTLVSGQPHVLFTIKEEEDLETGAPDHPKKKKSKWNAISKSMESMMMGIVTPGTTAFNVTPPHHNTQATSCSLQVNRQPLQTLISNLGLTDRSPWIHGSV